MTTNTTTQLVDDPAVVLATAHESHGGLAVLVLILVAVGGYWISLKLHPYTNCRHCAGTAKHRGDVFTHAHRACRHCDGTGRTLRTGARLFTSHNRRP